MKNVGLYFLVFHSISILHPCVMQAYLHLLLQLHALNYASTLGQKEREREGESEIDRIGESSYVSMVSIHQRSLMRSEVACKLLQP